MIIIEGKTIPTGEGVTVRPLTLDDCIEWRNDLVDVSDAEELLDILLEEIRRLHTKAEIDRSASDADLAKDMPNAEAKKALGNLLSVIHRDGGHAINRLGWAEACRQAEAVVVEHLDSRQRAERLAQRLRDLGFEELTQDQRAWNRLVNLGIGDKP